ncbi:MAG: aminotransferase [Rhodospirillales bacterium]
MNILRNLGTEQLQEKDNTFIHPWEGFKKYGDNKRTIIKKAEGVYFQDSEGNRLLDGPGGMWCVNIGYGREEMAEAIYEQTLEMPYCSPWSLGNEPAAVLAAKLAELTPGDLNNTFFTSSGSAAVDSALRFVMFYNNVLGRPEKKHFISRKRAYHGSTYLAASASGKERDKSFMDFDTEHFHHLSDPESYRRPNNMSVEQWLEFLVQEFENKILELGADKVAAFIGEPLLASGGVSIPPEGYHKRFLEVCRKHDVLYISDEVVTAWGRLGHWFASEDVFGIQPDIITTAKGITSGYQPLGAVFISDRLIENLKSDKAAAGYFSNGYTYSGHPVACAAALKNIEIIEREGILEHVREVGPYMQKQLEALDPLPIVGDVRGVGLLGCVECVISKDSKEALSLDHEIGARIDAHCQKLGLLVRPLINMCVFSPPLIITKAQIDDMVSILKTGIERATEDVRKEGLWNG